MFEQIIYTSTATRAMQSPDLEALLIQARANNERSGITGMLLYSKGNFLQVIEGPPSTVESAFRQIHRDPRHYNVMILVRRKIETREFADWQMGFNTWTPERLSTLPGYSRFMDMASWSTYFGENPQLAHDLLLMFREHMR